MQIFNTTKSSMLKLQVLMLAFIYWWWSRL